MIEIRHASKDEIKKWDDWIEGSLNSILFHKWDFLKIMEKHTKSKLHPLIGFKGEEPVGLLPVFEQKRSFLKTVFSPPPQISVPYMGPVFIGFENLPQHKKEPAYMEFFKSADAYIMETLKPNFIQMSTQPGSLDCRQFKWIGYETEAMYNYVVDLTGGEGKIWGDFKKKLRQDIKRTEKKGITVSEGGREELLYVYNSVSERYAEQGQDPSLPKQFLLDVYDKFHPQNIRIFVAKFNGEPIAGLIDIYFKDRAESWVGNVKSAISGIHPNDLLQWHTIKWACEHGLKQYIIMGANTPRLSPFKLKYNPQIEINFQAKKYSPFYIEWAEHAYKTLKRTRERVQYGREI